jgi:hypothetical protein
MIVPLRAEAFGRREMIFPEIMEGRCCPSEIVHRGFEEQAYATDVNFGGEVIVLSTSMIVLPIRDRSPDDRNVPPARHRRARRSRPSRFDAIATAVQ